MDEGTKRILEWLSWGVILFLFFFDRYQKYLEISSDDYFINESAAFGLFLPRWLIILLATVIILLLIKETAVLARKRKRFQLLSVSAIIAGGVGNMIDRFRYGGVLDYIETFAWIPVFNFSDLLITIGVIGVGLSLFMNTPHEKNT